jgi:hypothetical protein
MDGLSPGPRATLDQSPRLEPRHQRSEGLVRVEGPLRELMLRASRIPLNLPKRVPLNETDAGSREARIQRPVMAVLRSFDQPPEVLRLA